MNFQINAQEWERLPEQLRELILALFEQSRSLAVENESLKKRIELHETDLGPVLQRMGKIARCQSRTPKQVVFISESPATRQAKLAYGLTKSGWEVILLHRNNCNFEPNDFFTKSYRYSDPLEAAILACRFSPTAYHCFSSWSFDVSQFVIKLNPGGAIIYDDYDIFLGLQPSHREKLTESMAKEQFCLENAQGICNRSLTLQLAKKHPSYNIKSPTIFFPEYCWNRSSEQSYSLRPKRTDGIHAVYVGDCCPQYFRDPKGLGCTDFDFISGLTSQGIHYHIYPFVGPSVRYEEAMKEYLELANHNPHFHVHSPLLCSDLISEISQYHFGIHVTQAAAYKDGIQVYTAEAFKYHLNNKMFDYVDAGLIPILHTGKAVTRMLDRFKATLTMSREQLLQNVHVLRDPELRARMETNVSRAREKYDVTHQAKRLGAFYERVARH